ncbi:MAG: dual specificity protein phosphatase family protein [Myxococcaceae bacterium]|nr:dual specificity protein phosphatase family protein [Myxococcaceae bacterium]
MDLDFLTPALAVGGRYEPQSCATLVQTHGIRRVVDVRLEACDDADLLRQHGIELLHLPTPDGEAVPPALLDAGVDWVNAQIDAGHRVYVHCEHGIGRSAVVALCVLCSRGLEPLEALRTAKRARWRISPSPEQLEGFTAWCRRRLQIAVPGFDALAHIAYAHLREGATAASF